MKHLSAPHVQDEQKNTFQQTSRDNLCYRISSEALMAGKTRIEIVHDNDIYQLSLTKNRKLILTK